MRERESGCKSSLSLSLTLSLLLFDALLCSENDLSGVEGEEGSCAQGDYIASVVNHLSSLCDPTDPVSPACVVSTNLLQGKPPLTCCQDLKGAKGTVPRGRNTISILSGHTFPPRPPSLQVRSTKLS